MYAIVDFETKEEVFPESLVFTGEEVPWEIAMDLKAVKKKINVDHFRRISPCLSKYLPLLPVKNYNNFLSLQEEATPLVQSKSLGKRLGIDLFFKLEGKNLTGSFKDRGSAMEVSIARELNAKQIVVASTGNMAASCSCYAAAAKIPCFVFVPEGVTRVKLSQAMSYGGKIVQIKGSFNDAANTAFSVAKRMNFFLAGDYAFRVEGQKTAAFELLDQMSFQGPDMLILPMGCGTNIASYAKGFLEYIQLGFIKEMPKLVGVQADGASPIVQSFQRGKRDVFSWDTADTIASAISVAHPLDGTKALKAIYSTGGKAVSVSDQEILYSQYLLAKEEGLFVESSSASSFAALVKLFYKGSMSRKKVVCVLTGDGLKDPSVILKSAIKPPKVYPGEENFISLYKRGFFKGQNFLFKGKSKILFKDLPSRDKISECLLRLFSRKFNEEELEDIKSSIQSCLSKGKCVNLSDFQDIVQGVLETPKNTRKKIFSVLDFQVSTGMDRIPEAKVEVNFLGKRCISTGKGVGPIDALIRSLHSACEGGVDYKLDDYKVATRSQSVDALVYVEIRLIKDKRLSVGKATSPDLIQASVKAFEEAYNGFFYTDASLSACLQSGWK